MSTIIFNKANLKVIQPNDPAELEADRIADEVMARSSLDTPEQGLEGVDEEPLYPKIQAKRSGQGLEVDSSVENEINSLSGGTPPLGDSERGFFESRFGADFSGVRVHDDSKAHELARGLNAKAFTKGRDIVFGASEYSPGTTEGKRLMAHELAHVVQGNLSINKSDNSQKIMMKQKGILNWKFRIEYVDIKNPPWEDKKLVFEKRSYNEWVEFLINKADTYDGSEELLLFMATAVGKPEEGVIIKSKGPDHVGYGYHYSDFNYSGPSDKDLTQSAKNLIKAMLKTKKMDLANRYVVEGAVQEGSNIGLQNLPKIMKAFSSKYMGLVLSEMDIKKEISEKSEENFIDEAGGGSVFIGCVDAAKIMIMNVFNLATSQSTRKEIDNLIENLNLIGIFTGKAIKQLKEEEEATVDNIGDLFNLVLAIIPAAIITTKTIQVIAVSTITYLLGYLEDHVTDNWDTSNDTDVAKSIGNKMKNYLELLLEKKSIDNYTYMCVKCAMDNFLWGIDLGRLK